MLIAGYHGTTRNNAKQILKSKEFKISNGEKEWVGRGIYFYPDINDAYCWRKSESILHTVIKVDSNEYLDLDSLEGQLIYRGVLRLIKCTMPCLNTSDPEKNQCAVMNIIWDVYKHLKVISGSFAKEETKIRTLVDFRERRKEFCVRDNESIVYIQEIKRGDLDDT